MPAARRLLISYDQQAVPDGGLLVVASPAAPAKAHWLEPAGHLFHAAALRATGLGGTADGAAAPGAAENGAAASDGTAGSTSSSSPASAWDSKSSKSRKKGKHGGESDYYALLGLAHLRYLATEDQIRKAYREAALKHHPDKQAATLLEHDTEEAKAEKREEIDAHFKSIQEGYEILMDPAKRRVFDSTDEFDDEVPSECSLDDFFKVFGPVFQRNGRWSTVQPVCLLGDIDTSIAEVDRFYDFWWTFKSWREFPDDDEYDLESAESREHKRWMERQNSKLREKAKKEEYARLRTLVENAYRKDPRIQKRKDDEKAEKQARKHAKQQAKKEQEEAALRAVEEEKERKREEDKRAALEAAEQKKVREKEKKLIRKERSRLRLAAADCIAADLAKRNHGVPDDDVESICMGCDLTQLRWICETVEKAEEQDQQAAALQAALACLKVGNWDDFLPQEEAANPTDGSRKEAGTPAPAEAAQPASNGNGAAVGEGGSGKSNVFEKECKKERPWGKDEVELLRKALLKYPKGTSQRWEVIGTYLGTNRSVDEILRAIKTVLLQKPDDSKAFETFVQKRKPPATISSPLSSRDEDVQASTAVTANGTTGEDHKVGKDGAEPENGLNEVTVAKCMANGSPVDSEAWSEGQEVALVKALKAFPKDTTARWERIAAAVPGKNKNQCYKRFVALRDSFRNKKGENGVD
eukprot:SM000100S09422  [mRNA]  locus=s100:220116:225364:- [translate_table: standard]